MTKEELINHMNKVLEEVVAQDEENWEEVLRAGDYMEIDLDKAWHNGYMSAITTVRNLL